MYITLGFSSKSKSFRKFLIVACEVLLCTVTLNPTSGQILCHICVPLIVSRFSFFIEDLVVGYDDVTKLGRAVYVAFGIASVRLQISQFGFLGKCVSELCFPLNLFE